MSFEESLETTRIHSVTGLLPPGCGLIPERPFRHPHHTISDAGLVGGGSVPRPGEVSMAHNGVLFLDELPESPRNVLEVMRQPLEERRVTIARAQMTLTFPASFVLVAASNPCPCGFANDFRRECFCTPPQIQRYMSKISGPLMDRIDIQIDVPAVPYKELANTRAAESSETIRMRVVGARNIQAAPLLRREDLHERADGTPSHPQVLRADPRLRKDHGKRRHQTRLQRQRLRQNPQENPNNSLRKWVVAGVGCVATICEVPGQAHAVHERDSWRVGRSENPDFKDRFCEVDRDCRLVHDGLLVFFG
jgi:predicted ATPase with chaperone activity